MWMLNRKSSLRGAFEATVLVHLDALYGTALRLTRDVRGTAPGMLATQ